MSSLRRSARLAAKPRVSYYTPQNERDDVAITIEDYCKKNNLIYTDQLVDDFYNYLKEYPRYMYQKWHSPSQSYRSTSIIDKANTWAKYDSKTLYNQTYINTLHSSFIRYCENNHIHYTPLIYDKFISWYNHSDNYWLINSRPMTRYIHKDGSETYFPSTVYGNVCPEPQSVIIRRFFRATRL